MMLSITISSLKTSDSKMQLFEHPDFHYYTWVHPGILQKNVPKPHLYLGQRNLNARQFFKAFL